MAQDRIVSNLYGSGLYTIYLIRARKPAWVIHARDRLPFPPLQERKKAGLSKIDSPAPSPLV